MGLYLDFFECWLVDLIEFVFVLFLWFCKIVFVFGILIELFIGMFLRLLLLI